MDPLGCSTGVAVVRNNAYKFTAQLLVAGNFLAGRSEKIGSISASHADIFWKPEAQHGIVVAFNSITEYFTKNRILS